MSKPRETCDCLILGDHPATYLAAILLRAANLNILHTPVISEPSESKEDRLVLINPAFFDLHPHLTALRKKLDLTPIFGLTYLSEEPPTCGEYRPDATVAFVGSYRQIQSELKSLAIAQNVETSAPRDLTIHRLDETGIDLTLGKTDRRVRSLVVGTTLSPKLQKTLGINQPAAPQALHRYTFARLSRHCLPPSSPRPALPLCLNLGDSSCWGWLLTNGSTSQVCIHQPLETTASRPPETLLKLWIDILRRHHCLPPGKELPCESLHWLDIPLAGALESEGVANRTILIGPAGGFYSAATEDIYPNCWSSLFAADAIREALSARHLQDALNIYRSKWRTSLGDYLRGPSVNLKYLLPLIYRNPVMCQRISESILMGKGVVR